MSNLSEILIPLVKAALEANAQKENNEIILSAKNVMHGSIKCFNIEKGYGFISGNDGVERFFHISSVKSSARPVDGAEVEFTPSQNEKGACAINIHVITAKKRPARPEFVAFDSTRIKISTIKSYGIDKKNVYKYYHMFYDLVKELDYVRHYLYVTTYQKENYKFYADKVSFNIHDKFKELDMLLNWNAYHDQKESQESRNQYF